MRRHLIRKLGVALLAASVVFAGCSADISDAAGKDSGEEYVTLTVGVRNTEEAKTVMPDGMTTLKPAVWLLRGIGPSDSTFGGSVSAKDPYEADAEGKWASSTDGSFTVEKVRRGHWEFHVLGMTSDGARLVKGSAEADLAASGQDVTVTVRDLVTGDEGGSIPAGQAIVPTASWDASAATDVRLVVSGRKAQDAGWTVWYDGTLTDGTWTKSGGQDAAESTGSSLKLSVAAAAGTWYVRALLYDASDTAAPVAGMVEACRVVEGKTTSPDLALTIGKVVSDASVVVDATSLPITGAITEPESGSLVWRPDAAGYIMLKGQGILAGAAAGTEDAYASADMTVVDNEVASAIAGGKLTVAWYKDGMEDAKSLTTDGAKATVEGGNAATIGVTVSSTAAGSAASFTYAYAPAVESKTTVYTFTTDENGIGKITLKKPFSSTSEYEYVVDGEVFSHVYGTIIHTGEYVQDCAFNKDQSKRLAAVFGEEFTNSGASETKANEYAVSFRLVSGNSSDDPPISGAVVTVTETLDVITGMTTTVSADKTTQTWTGTPLLFGLNLPMSIKSSPLSTFHIVSAEAGVDDTVTASQWKKGQELFSDDLHWQILTNCLFNSEGFSESEGFLCLYTGNPALGYKEFTMTMTTPAWTQEVAATLTGGTSQEFALEKTVGSATRICGPTSSLDVTVLTPSASSTVSGAYEATFVPDPSYKDETVKIYLNAGLSGGNIVYKDKSMVMVPTGSHISSTKCTVYLGQ